jgi:hypothetical protein
VGAVAAGSRVRQGSLLAPRPPCSLMPAMLTRPSMRSPDPCSVLAAPTPLAHRPLRPPALLRQRVLGCRLARL